MADNKDCTYEYDYADKCDCSEDDKCGCSYPNNMPHDFGCTCSEDDEDENTLNCDCFENGEYAVNTLLCNRLIVHEQDDDEDGCCPRRYARQRRRRRVSPFRIHTRRIRPAFLLPCRLYVHLPVGNHRPQQPAGRI